MNDRWEEDFFWKEFFFQLVICIPAHPPFKKWMKRFDGKFSIIHVVIGRLEKRYSIYFVFIKIFSSLEESMGGIFSSGELAFFRADCKPSIWVPIFNIASRYLFKLYVNWCKNKISYVYISSKFSHRVLYALLAKIINFLFTYLTYI